MGLGTGNDWLSKMGEGNGAFSAGGLPHRIRMEGKVNKEDVEDVKKILTYMRSHRDNLNTCATDLTIVKVADETKLPIERVNALMLMLMQGGLVSVDFVSFSKLPVRIGGPGVHAIHLMEKADNPQREACILLEVLS